MVKKNQKVFTVVHQSKI